MTKQSAAGDVAIMAVVAVVVVADVATSLACCSCYSCCCSCCSSYCCCCSCCYSCEFSCFASYSSCCCGYCCCCCCRCRPDSSISNCKLLSSEKHLCPKTEIPKHSCSTAPHMRPRRNRRDQLQVPEEPEFKSNLGTCSRRNHRSSILQTLLATRVPFRVLCSRVPFRALYIRIPFRVLYIMAPHRAVAANLTCTGGGTSKQAPGTVKFEVGRARSRTQGLRLLYRRLSEVDIRQASGFCLYV